MALLDIGDTDAYQIVHVLGTLATDCGKVADDSAFALETMIFREAEKQWNDLRDRFELALDKSDENPGKTIRV
jgi:hypothetical protein